MLGKPDRFVRLNLYGDSDGLEIWGVLTGLSWREFLALWSTDMVGASHEFGSAFNGITDTEAETIIDAEECDTPAEAWAALAHYRMTGARLLIELSKERTNEPTPTG